MDGDGRYEYHAAKPFQGDVEKALTFAAAALTAAGFRIERQTTESIELIGPQMMGRGRNPLAGASSIRIAHRGGQIAIDADLGGVRRIVRFVRVFPLALCLFMAVVFGIVGLATGQLAEFLPGVAVVIGPNILVWLALAPLMARHLRNRTLTQLDVVLTNTVAVGGR